MIIYDLKSHETVEKVYGTFKSQQNDIGTTIERDRMAQNAEKLTLKDAVRYRTLKHQNDISHDDINPGLRGPKD